MGTINYVAFVIFAVIFISAGLAIYTNYRQGAAEQEFRTKAEELAGQIGSLADMSVGTSLNFDICVPSGCEMSFVDNVVLITIGEWSDNFSAGVSVAGQTFSNQTLSLKLERTESGVSVSEQT